MVLGESLFVCSQSCQKINRIFIWSSNGIHNNQLL